MDYNQYNAAPYAASAPVYGASAPAAAAAGAPVSGGMFGGMTIDYKKILFALGENILVIILAALVCGGAFFGYTFFFTSPSYTSSVMVYINKSTVSISGAELVLSSGEGYVDTYTTLLSSRTTLEEIAETAGVDYTPDQLKRMISTTSTSGSPFLTINVSCGSPTEAELIANTIASVLPTRVSDIVEGSTLRIVDYAIVPSSRSTDSLVRNFLIGLVAGAGIVCVLIALKVFFQMNHAPLITSSTDLTTYYPEVPVLGVIRDLSYSDTRYRHADYGYGKYSDYYSKPNAKAAAADRDENDAFSLYRTSSSRASKKETTGEYPNEYKAGHISEHKNEHKSKHKNEQEKYSQTHEGSHVEPEE